MRKTDEIFVRAMFVDEKNRKSLRSFIVEAVWWFLLVWSFNLTLQPRRLFNGLAIFIFSSNKIHMVNILIFVSLLNTIYILLGFPE